MSFGTCSILDLVEIFDDVFSIGIYCSGMCVYIGMLLLRFSEHLNFLPHSSRVNHCAFVVGSEDSMCLF